MGINSLAEEAEIMLRNCLADHLTDFDKHWVVTKLKFSSTIARPCWVDHSLKICVLNLRYARAGRAKNAKKAKGMPYLMCGIFCLTTFPSIHDIKF